MMRLAKSLRRLRDARGVTLVEFALIAPSLCMTLLAFTDFGYRSYVDSVLQGALLQAARSATVGDKTGAQIDQQVNDSLKAFSSGATVTIVKKSYEDFSGVKKPEKITEDTAPIGTYNKGDCFEDANGNGTYDLDQGKGGLGGAEDIVDYEVSITFPRLVPMGGFLGLDNTQTISGSTVLRNQPYAARSSSAIVC